MTEDVRVVAGGKLEKKTRAIGVVLTWTEIKNAEYEVVHRVCRAAKNIDLDVYVINNDGYQLWSSLEGSLKSSKRVTADDCEFIISLHFESPRLYDIFSYTALWNPPEFYLGMGHERTIEQLASHNDVLSCHSDIADIHAENLYLGLGRPLTFPLPTLFHSIPGPYPEPKITEESRLFYIGINWERINGERGRHHELLRLLNDEDLIDIYGPKIFLGKEPWEGFESYRGEIPFDGKSVIQKINDSGICLALSSAAHQRSGIMSNRLFEGLAAGSIIVANRNAFINKYFADCVYIVDDNATPESLAAQVRNIVLDIRKNLPEARERAFRGQKRFKESFTLEGCLKAILEDHSTRVDQFVSKMVGAAEHEVTVILDYTGLDYDTMKKMLDNVIRQARCIIHLIVICDKKLQSSFEDQIRLRVEPAVRSLKMLSGIFYNSGDSFDEPMSRLRSAGLLFAEAIADIATDCVCLMQADDHWFSDHLATLAHALFNNPESSFACSGRIMETEEGGKLVRRLDSLFFHNFESLVDGFYARDVGRFLYRTAMVRKIPKSLVILMDDMHNRCFNTWAMFEGKLALTNYASYVRLDWQSDALPEPFYDTKYQTQFLRDAVRGNPEWIRLSALFHQYRPPETTQPTKIAPKIQLDHRYGLHKNGDGLGMIRDGFSWPEDGFIWIDGLQCELEFELLSTVEDLDLLLVLGARNKTGSLANQHLTVVVNDVKLGRLLIGEAQDDYRIQIPAALITKKKVSLTIELQHAEAVVDATGNVVDQRRLGLRIYEIGVMRHIDGMPPVIELPSPAMSNRSRAIRVGKEILVSRRLPIRAAIAKLTRKLR